VLVYIIFGGWRENERMITKAENPKAFEAGPSLRFGMTCFFVLMPRQKAAA